ncbi:c-type cytochrome biogenesis protein CcmI [Rhizobium paknamense]|uniref:Cytochrome c-type biogenesis protein CcmH n=1 Tax=Rhizobium paknamense TaxID=1206817 RepID=A0ABU0IAK4_9HYPH|nr:c-type cytochrome biogenesis protein CcmI [Rhizobium paknamense]MDQ0454269.1 cytochrome c-type biogenesis protein CcmH [Rhizobium paknamense]
MLFWIVIAVLTFAVAAAFLLPLIRATPSAADDAQAAAMAIYRDQLKELERDKAAGLISGEEAEGARAEIARRLLATDGGARAAAKPQSRHGLAQAFVVVMVPLVSLALYLLVGSPGLPSQPLAARLENPGNDINLLVAKAERHLMDNPDDGAGWDLLAPIYARLNRQGDAELAYRNALRLKGPGADRLNGLGEVLMAENDGIVTDEAQALFRQSLALERNNPRAAYYLALGLEQAGRKGEALDAFRAIAEASPADAPWMPLVARHVEKNGGGPLAQEPAKDAAKAPGNPSQADVAAAETLSSGDRQQMIRGMVESLDAKLKADPANFEGWMRLIRSYAVLKDEAKAVEALKAGLKAFPAEGAEGRQLIAMAEQMGLPVTEALK